METAVKNGLLMGLVSIVFTLVIYFIDPTIFGNFIFSFAMIGFSLVLGVIFSRMTVNALPLPKGAEMLSFGQRFVPILVMFVTSVVLGSVFNYVLYNFIDPELGETIKQAMIDNMTNMMSNFGADEAATDAALQGLEETEFNMTLQRTFTQMLSGLIMGAIFSAIFAAIFKGKRTSSF